MERVAFGVFMSFLAVGVSGAEVSLPYEFTAGETARADHVNKNFTALENAVNNLLDQTQSLQEESSKLKQSVVDLSNQLKAQKDENARLKKTISDTQAATSRNQSQLKAQKDESARLKKTISDTQAAMSRNQSALQALVEKRRSELAKLIDARGIYSLKWTSSNAGRDKLKKQRYACVQIIEAADPHTWKDNWLCYKRKP